MRNIYTTSFIIYLSVLSLFLIYTFTYNYVFSDEGTHLLLSIFYKDVISNLPQTGLSYEKIYNFGINYLVHYPKLQIAYPPLYHLANAASFFVFGESVFLARLVNLFFAVLTFSVFYVLVRKYFNEKTAFISTIFFSFSSYSLLYASRAFQDFTAYFFIILSIWVFAKVIETKKTKYFLILSLTSSLAVLSKQISAIAVVFFVAYLLYRKDMKPARFKNLALFISVLALLLSPYAAILKMSGGFEINKIVAIGYASQQGEPTNPFDPMFWLYFLVQPIFFAPFSTMFLSLFTFYLYKKERYWKEFLIFFLVFYISLSAIPNKEQRFSQLFTLPCYVAAGFCLSKIKNKAILPAIIILYFAVSLLIFYPTIQSYPQEKISEDVYKNLPNGAAISLFSDDEPMFSSALIADIRLLDKNGKAVIIRSCAFSNKTKEDILKILDETNTYFVLHSEWSKDKTIEKIKDSLRLTSETVKNNMTTRVYTYNNFKNKKPEKICNYICLTGEKICEK